MWGMVCVGVVGGGVVGQGNALQSPSLFPFFLSFLPLVGQVLGGGEREARRDDALDGGVVRQVEEEDGALWRWRRRGGDESVA